MVEQATFLSQKLEFRIMVMSMLMGNPDGRIATMQVSCWSAQLRDYD